MAPLKNTKLGTALSLAFVLVLSACTGQVPLNELRETGDYWQRNDSTSALYVRGPKAQHQLHSDISSCVTEVKELLHLGSIRSATPPDGIAMTGQMKARWDTPRGDGPLYTEYTEFHDFESCMVYKGWERVDFVAPEVANRAAINYSETILGLPLPGIWKDDEHTPKQRGEYGYNN